MHKHTLIYTDPPWPQRRGSGKKNYSPLAGGDLEYKTIPICEIESIQRSFRDAAASDHILFMWAIERFLSEAEDMVRDLGYKIHCRMVWDKGNGPAPAYTIRYAHEYLLYCYHGRMIPVDVAERGKIASVFRGASHRHSQKPQEAYEIIERLYPRERKIELFARNTRDGWDSWGDEVG